MSEDLKDWLDGNHIMYTEIDEEVFEVEGFGKIFENDLSGVESIFRKDHEGHTVFNLMATKAELTGADICYVCFKFGNNWYYYDIRGAFALNILKYIGKRRPTLRQNEFVNLGIHTPYELLNGSFQLQDWVTKAKYLGHKAIGICDKHTMAGTLQLQKECKRAGIGYVMGYTCDLVCEDEKVEIKLYCQTDRGLRNLLRIQKCINVDSENRQLTMADLLKHCEGNVIVFSTISSHWLSQHMELVEQLRRQTDVYYQVDLTEFKADRFDRAYLEAIRHYYTSHLDLPPVLICDNYYLDKGDARNKIILNKVASGVAHMQSDEQYYKDVDELYVVFDSLFGAGWDKEKLFNELCANSVKIAEGAHCGYETDRNFMPQYDMTEEEKRLYGDRHTMFNQLIEDGFKRLVPKGCEETYRKRVEHEKYVIESTNNVDYFLVQYDTVRWANEQGIMTGISRGSGGGCLLLYLMGITKLDPMQYNLIFERFLLPDRSGLYEAKVTKIVGRMDSQQYVEVELAGRKLLLERDALLLVERNGETLEVFADELKRGDDIVFDNRDLLWTIDEV